MQLKSLQDADLKGKRVIVRFDFNVPLTKTETRKITDTSRIDQAIPTIRLILEKGASKIVMIFMALLNSPRRINIFFGGEHFGF